MSQIMRLRSCKTGQVLQNELEVCLIAVKFLRKITISETAENAYITDLFLKCTVLLRHLQTKPSTKVTKLIYYMQFLDLF